MLKQGPGFLPANDYADPAMRQEGLWERLANWAEVAQRSLRKMSQFLERLLGPQCQARHVEAVAFALASTDANLRASGSQAVVSGADVRAMEPFATTIPIEPRLAVGKADRPVPLSDRRQREACQVDLQLGRPQGLDLRSPEPIAPGLGAGTRGSTISGGRRRKPG